MPAGQIFLFQFTPLREGRLKGACPLYAKHENFNSRPYARGDKIMFTSSLRFPTHFNSRPYARGDPDGETLKHAFDLFQFTPLREGRLVLHSRITRL